MDQNQIQISWDWENCQVANVSFTIASIKMFMAKFLPGLDISGFKCFGNIGLLTSEQRSSFKDVLFIDVPGGKKDAADRKMMVDVMLFKKDLSRVGYILLITGDLDFYESVRVLYRQGLKVILAYPENGTNPELLKIVGEGYCISWERLSSGTINVNPFVGDKHMLNLANELAPSKHVGTAVFWNTISCPLPCLQLPSGGFEWNKSLKDQRDQRQCNIAFTCIDRILHSHPKTAYRPVIGYAYSTDNKIARYGRPEFDYINVTRLKHEKVGNRMLADIMHFTSKCPAPANIVILTDDENFGQIVELLKMRRYIVLVIVRSLSKAGWESLKAAAGQDFFVWEDQLKAVQFER